MLTFPCNHTCQQPTPPTPCNFKSYAAMVLFVYGSMPARCPACMPCWMCASMHVHQQQAPWYALAYMVAQGVGSHWFCAQKGKLSAWSRDDLYMAMHMLMLEYCAHMCVQLLCTHAMQSCFWFAHFHRVCTWCVGECLTYGCHVVMLAMTGRCAHAFIATRDGVSTHQQQETKSLSPGGTRFWNSCFDPVKRG